MQTTVDESFVDWQRDTNPLVMVKKVIFNEVGRLTKETAKHEDKNRIFRVENPYKQADSEVIEEASW